MLGDTGTSGPSNRRLVRGAALLVSLSTALLVYFVWTSMHANPLRGSWHLSGRCVQPGYHWLSGCLVGLQFGSNPRMHLQFVEEEDPVVLNYVAEYPIPQTREGSITITPHHFPVMRWYFRLEERKLFIRMAKDGPWVPFERGEARPGDADFSVPVDRAGIEVKYEILSDSAPLPPGASPSASLTPSLPAPPLSATPTVSPPAAGP